MAASRKSSLSTSPHRSLADLVSNSFADNWGVAPTLPPKKCTFKTQNLLVTVVLNVITDAAILAVPFEMLWTLQIPMRQNIVIVILLSSGIFVITAAIIRIAVTLGTAPSALTINRWGVRETIVGILAVNAPILRPLFSKTFWTRSGPSYLDKSSGNKTGRSTGTGTRGGTRTGPHGPYELAESVTSKSRGRGRGNSFTGSEASIVMKAADSGTGSGTGALSHADGVIVHTVYQVTDAPRSSGSPDWEQGTSHHATAFGTRSPV